MSADTWIELYWDGYENTGTFYLAAPRLRVIKPPEGAICYLLYAGSEPYNLKVASRPINVAKEYISLYPYVDLQPGVYYLRLSAMLGDGSEVFSNIVRFNFIETLNPLEPGDGGVIAYDPGGGITFTWESPSGTHYDVYRLTVRSEQTGLHHGTMTFGGKTSCTLMNSLTNFGPGEYTWWVTGVSPTGWTDGYVSESTAAASYGTKFIVK